MSGRINQPRRHRAQRQARLAELLLKRDQTAEEWAERFSHGLDGVPQLTLELIHLEAALTDGWPHLTDTWVGEWAVADVRKLHDPDVGTEPGCAVCTGRLQPSAG